MVLEVLLTLTLPLYVILFVSHMVVTLLCNKDDIRCRNILNNKCLADTPKEGTEQHNKRECLKGAI